VPDKFAQRRMGAAQVDVFRKHVRQSGGVPEQVANLDFIAFSALEAGQILVDRIAHGDKAALNEQHQRACRDRLGNRGQQKHRIRTH
jgi:hypothetical protein